MGLESGTYIDSLVDTNPVGATDPKSQGDDHIRLLKSTIQATFPNLTGAMTADQDELNLLDGVPGTLTTTEIGYLDGVVSPIQTQIDSNQTQIDNILQPVGLATISTSAVSQSAGILDSATIVTSPVGTTTVTYDSSQASGTAYLILLTVQQASGNSRSSIVTTRTTAAFEIETVASNGSAANFNRMFIAVYNIGI